MIRSLSVVSRKWSAVLAAVVLAGGIALGAAPSAAALPPGIPSKAQAQSELNSLTVRSEESMTGYSRSLFPHWITISGTCNTRETVLKRDADSYTVDANCNLTSGKWYSYYEGVTRSSASQMSIDHVVALAEAWRSGARQWTTDRRKAFANDLSGPQLIAVTTEINSSKGDRDPASWVPPRSGARCTYAKMWIHSKYKWGLHLQSSEKSALQGLVGACSY
ncbi:HNH endonuclease family protein [Streptomyces sp. NPDC058045]|uniref:HNH endonuclease family protein n=1 Tax=Streptomyces sp. NPDC058045 TaxID=3346311 RepID=UPI0036E32004